MFFSLGLLLMYLFFKSTSYSSGNKETQLLSYQISKLNKLIVIEEEYRGLHKEKLRPNYGISFKNDYINLTETEITFDVKVKTQVTYDMKKIQIEVDSVTKKIHIKYIPEPEITYFPELSVRDLNQGLFNKFSKEEINKVSENAKKGILKKIDSKNINQKAHKQLIDNLKDIYFIAKTYNWQIVDDTKYANEMKYFLN